MLLSLVVAVEVLIRVLAVVLVVIELVAHLLLVHLPWQSLLVQVELVESKVQVQWSFPPLVVLDKQMVKMAVLVLGTL
tara:strand:+ start:246 stop:479 length:234 start_codon:yes stop_codon:yes gene_type:complete